MSTGIEELIAEVVAKASRSAQPRALAGLAQERIAQGDDAGALKCFDKALQLDASHATAWMGRAEILVRQERFVEALGCVNRAVDAGLRSAKPLALKAELLVKTAKRAEAVEAYRELLTVDPTLRSRWLEWAKLLEDLERWDDALAAYERANEFAETPDVCMRRAELFMQQGMLAEAAQSFARALALAPDDLDASYRLARARMKLQDVGGAREALEHFLRVAPPADPRVSSARKMLNDMRGTLGAAGSMRPPGSSAYSSMRPPGGGAPASERAPRSSASGSLRPPGAPASERAPVPGAYSSIRPPGAPASERAPVSSASGSLRPPPAISPSQRPPDASAPPSSRRPAPAVMPAQRPPGASASPSLRPAPAVNPSQRPPGATGSPSLRPAAVPSTPPRSSQAPAGAAHDASGEGVASPAAIQERLTEIAALFVAGEALQALRSIGPVVAGAPSSTAAWLLRSRILISLGQLDAAITSLETLTQLDKKHALGWSLMATCWADLKRPDHALAVIQHAIDAEPEDPAAHRLRARFLIALKRTDEARDVLVKTVALAQRVRAPALADEARALLAELGGPRDAR